ncbi:CD3337/EF1877 family mobilome membrane protein [Bacillus toyonensis]|uniref:CD3337/EF1877 family mobilome membrane protein n=1 Tax=Bacillus toyonensis TaxID=155322 RepID=UPI002E23A806|nr:CPBP family intramembrane metalloprotease [Bacillus toyonensis]
MKKLLSLCMILVFLLMPLGSSVTLAEEEKKQEQMGPRISENLFKGYTDDVYKGKYYEVDTEAPKKDEKGVIEKVGSYFFGEDSIGKDIQRMIYTTCQWFVNLAFKLNIMLTQLTMFLVDQALNLDIVSGVADKLAASMQNISGIGEDEEGNVNFLSGGLFPSIISLMCVLSACYAAYVFFIKRQPTAGLNELVKTVLVIAFILVFIGNAGTVLKTANTISSEVSTTILAKATGTVAGDPGRSQKQAISSVKKQIWSILVERPYLFMQYGEDSKEKIGEERVNKLLKTAPGKGRNSIVDDEVKQGNQMMKLDSVGDRIIFTLIYYIVNTFVGVPILVFCLLIVAFQLWFLVMSLIAPIVLAVALLPGHRKVIESWATQWIRPLALKVLMSIMLVIIFTVSELLYVLPEAGLAGYVSTMVFQIIVFILCYIFRDNITASFKKTKNIYRTMTDISLMTENFANRGKEMAMDVGGAISERVGDHFNSAAELVAAGEPEAIEKGETKEEEDKKPKLAKVDVPADLSAYEKNEENEEGEENSKNKKLISLQDHRQEEQEAPEQNEQDMPEQQLARLDPEELEKAMETAEEAGAIDTENQEQDREYASLEEFTDTTPQEENLENLPHLDIPQEHISDDTSINDPYVALDEHVIPEIMPEQTGTEGVIYPQDTDIDVESPIQQTTTETPTISAPRETVTIPDLIPATITPDGEIRPQQEIGVSVLPSEIANSTITANTHVDAVVPQDVIDTPSVSTPNETITIPELISATVSPDGKIEPRQEIEVQTPPVIPDAIAAGSEDWNLPTQEPK